MPSDEHELRILEEIDRNPEVTQAGLAAQLGVAVGSVNWYVKRLIGKGYIKVTHLERRRLHYFLTPAGLVLKVKLTKSYMDVSLRVYRELRRSARATLQQVQASGYSAVAIIGDDESAEILRLTCLELGVKVDKRSPRLPAICTSGKDFVVKWPSDHLCNVRRVGI